MFNTKNLKRVRSTLLFTAALAGMSDAALAQGRSHHFDIPAGDAARSLQTYARQSGKQVLFNHDLIKGRRMPALRGRYSDEAALQRLLTATGLTISSSNASTITISPALKPTSQFTAQDTKFSPAGDKAATSGLTTDEENSGASEVIIVTAQKVEQRVQDVPASVSVLASDSLLESNRLSLRDFFTQVPGLSLQTDPFQGLKLSIRGVSNQIAGLPTVSVLIDDAPLTSQVAGFVIPEIDPDQIARIEVLKGPQGTLYGASTMGGLLKYVTKDPSTSGFSGSVQGGVSGVDHSGMLGYNIRGNVNVALTDTLAVRAGAFHRVDPGYIDNVLTGEDDTNSRHITGGSITALWRPSPDWSLRLNALYQRTRSDAATDDVDLAAPDSYSTTHSRAKNSQLYRVSTAAFSAILKGNISGIDLTNITAYNLTNHEHTVDYSSAVGFLTQALYGVSGAIVPGEFKVRNFSNELRLNGSAFNLVDWTLGGYFANQRADISEIVVAEDPITGVIVPGSEELLSDFVYARYKEISLFASAKLNLTDKMIVEIGGRQTNVRVSNTIGATGILGNIDSPWQKVKQNKFTFSATASYKLDSNSMIYGRVASAFRAGGFNETARASSFGVVVPPTYDPDETVNYELGLKGSLLDGRIQGDISAYYIDWKNIQLGSCQFNQNGVAFCYTTNASGGKSAGVELQMNGKLWRGATLQGWISYNDAEITEDFPATSTAVGLRGDPLPFNAKYSGDIALTQQFEINNSATASVSIGLNYVGSRKGKFQATGVRQAYDSYTTLRATAGLSKGPWSATVFVNNLTNSHGALIGGLDYFPPAGAFVFVAPRSYGLNLRREF